MESTPSQPHTFHVMVRRGEKSNVKGPTIRRCELIIPKEYRGFKLFARASTSASQDLSKRIMELLKGVDWRSQDFVDTLSCALSTGFKRLWAHPSQLSMASP